MSRDSFPTSVTLMGELRQNPTNEQAWLTLAQRYVPRVYGWLIRHNVQPADAEDLTQEVFVKLHKNRQKFQYDQRKSFRNYLTTMVRNCWIDWLERQTKRRHEVGIGYLPGQPTLQETCNALEQGIETEYQLELLQQAETVLRVQVKPQVWASFERVVHDGKKPEVVAEELGITRGAVYKNKQRIQQKLEELVNQFQRYDDPDEPSIS
ncbi:MAG: RNA polymerase sigma factor [Gemmataceae bacterium]